MHLKIIKIGELLYSHFNIEDGSKKQHFGILHSTISRKIKTQLKPQKSIFYSVWRSALTDQMFQKWFAVFCAGGFLMDNAAQSGRPIEADRNQRETLRIISITLWGR